MVCKQWTTYGGICPWFHPNSEKKKTINLWSGQTSSMDPPCYCDCGCSGVASRKFNQLPVHLWALWIKLIYKPSQNHWRTSGSFKLLNILPLLDSSSCNPSSRSYKTSFCSHLDLVFLMLCLVRDKEECLFGADWYIYIMLHSVRIHDRVVLFNS